MAHGLTEGERPSPQPSPKGRGRDHYRGGLKYAGLKGPTRELRRRETSAEYALWRRLRNRRLLGLKFRRQHQIGLYVVGFYCHGKRLVVELDGEVHRGSRRQDRARDAWLQAEGFTVFRFPNQAVLGSLEMVLRTIAAVEGAPGEAQGKATEET